MSDAPKDDPEYAVGYRRPPREHRFRKGMSGNPSGRPKGALTARTIPEIAALILQESYREITITENGRPRKLPSLQASLRSMALNAVKGDLKAQIAFRDSASVAEAIIMRQRGEFIDRTINYILEMRSVIEAARKEGKPLPSIVPHPDDIGLDFETATVIYNGPQTYEEKAEWDQAVASINKLRALIRKDKSDLGKQPGDQRLIQRIRMSQLSLKIYELRYPTPAARRVAGFNLRKSRAEAQALVPELKEIRDNYPPIEFPPEPVKQQ